MVNKCQKTINKCHGKPPFISSSESICPSPDSSNLLKKSFLKAAPPGSWPGTKNCGPIFFWEDSWRWTINDHLGSLGGYIKDVKNWSVLSDWRFKLWVSGVAWGYYCCKINFVSLVCLRSWKPLGADREYKPDSTSSSLPEKRYERIIRKHMGG